MDEYQQFMENLSPCSSQPTIANVEDYNPIELNNLLTQRNDLSKLRTLTDYSETDLETEHIKFEGKLRRNSSKSSKVETIVAVEEINIKVLMVETNDEVFFTLSELIEFIKSQTNRNLSSEYLTVNHLLIYLSDVIHLNLNQIKLYHLGKPFFLNNPYKLSEVIFLIGDLKIDKFPCIHLVENNVAGQEFEITTQDALMKCSYKKPDSEVCVTYADAIVKKIKKSRFRTLKRLLRVSV